MSPAGAPSSLDMDSRYHPACSAQAMLRVNPVSLHWHREDYMHFIKVAYGTDDGYPDRPYAATNLLYRPGN